MKVFIKGGGEVNLTNKHFVAAGGQGQIYAHNGTAYKIYLDKSGMLPLGKIKELSTALTEPYFIKPEKVICDKKGSPIGYTMKFVKNGLALCQLFTPAFRNREGVSHDQVHELVQKLQEGISFAHEQKILLVDLNEFNFMVDNKFQHLYFIDADSYQTPHYPATALMESVKDWKATKFTELSDWYSFGILALQLYIGIHPYRGRYKGPTEAFKKKLPSDDPSDGFAVIRRRMQQHISIFNPDVGVPKSAYPLDVIPSQYREWFQNIFEEGKRLPPPGNVAITMVQLPVIRNIIGTDNLEIKEVSTYAGNLMGAYDSMGVMVAVTDKGVWVNNRQVLNRTVTHIGFSGRLNHTIALTKQEVPELWDLTNNTPINFGLRCSDAMSYDGRFYVQSQDKIIEVLISDLGTQTVASTKVVANVLEHATRMFPGCVIQDLLGSTFVSMFPQSGTTYQPHIKELDTYRVVDAKYDQGVLIVVGEHKGQYDRLVFRFSADHQTYDLRTVGAITPTGINFVTLDSGVAVCLNEEEKLELFSSHMGSQKVKIIEDPMLGGDMTLSKQNGSVVFYRGNKLYTMKMR